MGSVLYVLGGVVIIIFVGYFVVINVAVYAFFVDEIFGFSQRKKARIDKKISEERAEHQKVYEEQRIEVEIAARKLAKEQHDQQIVQQRRERMALRKKERVQEHDQKMREWNEEDLKNTELINRSLDSELVLIIEESQAFARKQRDKYNKDWLDREKRHDEADKKFLETGELPSPWADNPLFR